MFYFQYKNSILATFVSAIGALIIACGIAGLFSGEIGGALALILAGAAVMAAAKWISSEKAFRKWWKQVKDNHLEPEITKSTELAVAIYRKNPEKRTLRKIRALNPEAAAYIEKNIF